MMFPIAQDLVQAQSYGGESKKEKSQMYTERCSKGVSEMVGRLLLGFPQRCVTWGCG